MEDVSPKLLKMVRDSFQVSLDRDSKIKSIYEKIEAGTATYLEANDFAVRAGEHLAKAYKQISAADLPDGKMYYNIANSIIPPTMTNNYDLVSEIATQIQQNLNEEEGIGLKALTPELNQDRIDGIVNRISSEDDFDAIKWILDSPIVDFSQSIIDDSIRRNAEFHGEAGMTPKIVRKNAFFGCCKWCSKLQGTYVYPDVPQDVYRRHQNCRCTVDYHPGNGKVQNVHTKGWKKIEANDNRGRKIVEEFEKKKRIERDKGSKYIDATEFWEKTATGEKGNISYQQGFRYNSKYYPVDGVNVINEPSEHEIEIAELISTKYGKNVQFVPRVCGIYKDVQTPDYFIEGEKWDLKELTKSGKDALRDSIKRKEEQANNFIIDISNYSRGIESAIDQAHFVFEAYNTKFVEKLIIIKDKEVLEILERL